MTDITALVERLVEALEARRNIYRQKADQRDPLADDTLNEHEKYAFAVEAFDIAIHDLRQARSTLLSVGGSARAPGPA
jgi:hypothetical protein